MIADLWTIDVTLLPRHPGKESIALAHSRRALKMQRIQEAAMASVKHDQSQKYTEMAYSLLVCIYQAR